MYTCPSLKAILMLDVELLFAPTPTPSHSSSSSSLVCKLHKSLYGFKQAPRQWFSKLSTTLLSFGFLQSKADYNLFTHNSDTNITMVLVYVDDLLICGNNLSHISHLKSLLSKSFHMKDLGPVRYFLGLEIDSTPEGFFISQKKYTLDLLREYGMLNVRPLKLLM